MNLQELDRYLDYAQETGIETAEVRRFVAGYLVIHGASYRVANLLAYGDDDEKEDDKPVELPSKVTPKQLFLPGSRQALVQEIESQWDSDGEDEDPLAKDAAILEASYPQMERYGDDKLPIPSEDNVFPMCSSSDGTC